MITHFHISNFKRLQSADLELGSAAVFIGPNNSGKTSALQALVLWDLGLRRWVEKRDDSSASERQGVTISRRDLAAVPVPSAKLIWNMLRTQNSSKDAAMTRLIQVLDIMNKPGTQGVIGDAIRSVTRQHSQSDPGRHPLQRGALRNQWNMMV